MSFINRSRFKLVDNEMKKREESPLLTNKKKEQQYQIYLRFSSITYNLRFEIKSFFLYIYLKYQGIKYKKKYSQISNCQKRLTEKELTFNKTPKLRKKLFY